MVDLEEELSIQDITANKGNAEAQPLSVTAEEVKLLEDTKDRVKKVLAALKSAKGHGRWLFHKVIRSLFFVSRNTNSSLHVAI